MEQNPAIALGPRLFWVVIAIYIAVRLSISMLAYRGDTSPEATERALGHFSQEAIDAGLRYQRAGTPTAIVFFLLSSGALLIFLLSGLSAWLASECLRVTGGRTWLQVILYVSALLSAAWLASLPFFYYLDHTIERRFGFSNQTAGGWFVFQIKNALIGWTLALIAASLGYALLRRFPRAWVGMIPAGALALQLIMVVLYPIVILPLFYKIEPVEDEALTEAVSEVAEKAGVRLKALHLIDASRYSSHTNAFFTGFGKFKSIYLYDTLVKGHTPEEVGAIVAHELGHWRHNHVLKGVALYELGFIIACILLYFLYPIFEAAKFLHLGPMGDVSSLAFLLLLSSIVSFFMSPISSGVSRSFEREADMAGVELSGETEVFIRDFKKLAEHNHSNLLPHPLFVIWRYSHPPTLERIEAIEAAGNGAR